jgi:hypothetical protein
MAGEVAALAGRPEHDDRGAQVSQEITSGRDSFVAGRDLKITVVVGRVENAVEALADLPAAVAQAARSVAQTGLPALPRFGGGGADAASRAEQEDAPRWEAIPRPTAVPGPSATVRAGAITEPAIRLPWTPLATAAMVRGLEAGSRVTSDPGTCQVELHVVPATPLSAPARLIAPSLLMDVGRRAGLFPSSATLTPQSSDGLVAALLADPEGDPARAKAGLRVFADGQRSGWLTLPGALHRTGDDPLDPAVEEAIMMLVTATAGVRGGLPDRVAIAVAITAGPGAALSVPPRNWLPARYLVSHPRQVAADLAGQLAGSAG